MKNPTSEKAARLIGRRRGSALMMLIMALALLIGTYSATMARQSNNARRIEKEQDAITSLENAIDAVREINPIQIQFFRLPLDESRNQWIEINSTTGKDTETIYTAKLIDDGKEIVVIQRR